MKKLFSVLLVVCLLAMTLAVFTISSTAETEVVVWEGDINQEITTSQCIGIVNVDSLNQAIREDIAQNGTATKYVLTSTGSRYISGVSGYATFGFYQDDPDYVECWPDKAWSMDNVTWSDDRFLSMMGQDVFFCVFSDGTDTAYVGHIKLIATHESAPTEAEPTETQPTVPAIPDWQLVYEGAIAEQECDFTVDGTSPINDMSFMLAMANEIKTYGVSEKYKIISDAALSGGVGFACWGFWDTTNTESQWWGWDLYSAQYPYVITGDELSTVNFNENWMLGFVGDGICTVKADTFQVYAYRPAGESTKGVTPTGTEAEPTVTEAEPTATEAEPTATEAEPTVTEAEPTATEAEPTTTEAEPTVTEAEPTVTEAEPTATEAEPTVTEAEPTVTEAEPTVTETEPTVTEAEPTVTEAEPSETATATATKSSVTETQPTHSTDEIYGDANGDGAVNMKDVLLIRKYLADMADDIHLEASDVNVDGAVNMKDVLMIRKFLADMIDRFGA